MERDLVVVGAGFAGATIARLAAERLGAQVLVIDRRPHVAGNAFDERDEDGVLVHRYGPHLFHTNSGKVFSFLSRFTAWHGYEHRVLARVGDVHLPVPVNLDTVNAIFGIELREEEMPAFLAAQAEPVAEIRTGEDAVVARVGRRLYETFFEGYTRKQWGVEPRELDASVTARIPVRHDRDDRYFTDTHQALPREGYTRMFERLLDHPRIAVRLGTGYLDTRDDVFARHVVWTGPVDEWFGHRFGHLPYRSLHFRWERVETPGGGFHQPVAQVNHPGEDVAYTRVTEFRHLFGERRERSTLAYEFPRAEGDPFYPVPRPENRLLYKRYQHLAAECEHVTFAGRLARYQYLNMDQVVAQAMTAFEREVTPALAKVRMGATPARQRAAY